MVRLRRGAVLMAGAVLLCMPLAACTGGSGAGPADQAGQQASDSSDQSGGTAGSDSSAEDLDGAKQAAAGIFHSLAADDWEGVCRAMVDINDHTKPMQDSNLTICTQVVKAGLAERPLSADEKSELADLGPDDLTAEPGEDASATVGDASGRLDLTMRFIDGAWYMDISDQ